ncbi:MAG TPA: DUF294 nucleotidyltransferase-like domain-containing protein, partial [Dissulfurispiraceae bacterium]|nr:DUF294 nucleotidyltransferase-like domain-containing protein [Dissulfurispiraceae bacterium]
MEFYPKDTVILEQDGPASDFLRIIKKGGVKITKHREDGEDVVVDYRGEGDNFGFLSLIGKDKQDTTAIAIDDTICYLLGRERVLKLLESNPTFTEYFLKSHLSKYMHRTYQEMRRQSPLHGGGDHLLFTTQIGDVLSREVVTATEDMTIREAAQVMATSRVTSLVIVDGNNLPSGIVTDRDLREKVVAKGRSVEEPVRNVMSLPLIRVDVRDYCFEALSKMVRYDMHHILVIKDGHLRGVISNHDLMLLQGSFPLSFVKDIENQKSIEGLIPISKKITGIIGLLVKEGAKASNITKIISELNDRLVRKIIEIAEKRYGEPPVPYCWINFGSEGRREQSFRTDQDNGIIYRDPSSSQEAEEAKRYFSNFSVFVRDGFMKCGFALCPSQYMASNPQWRQPIKAWKKYFTDWIDAPTPDVILKTLIFFDFRPVYGEYALAEELRDHITPAMEGQKIFLGNVANVIVKNLPPLGFLKSFVVEKSGDHK